MRRKGIASLVVIVAMSAAHADAPYTPPDFLAQTPRLPASLEGAGVWRLPLAEALRIAVRGNLDVTLERAQVAQARLGIDVARGAFEPTVHAGYVHGDTRSPPASLQEGGANDIVTFVDDTWRIGLVERFSTGTAVSVDVDSSRAKSTQGTAVQPLNYRSTVSVSVTQPLLRGFSRDLVVPRLEVLRAKIASDRERLQLAVAISAVVERAEAAYWGVLLAVYRYDLARRSHEAAEQQMALTRRQIDAGVLPPSDLISAESTLAQRALELVQAEQAIAEASDQLRAVMNLPRDQWTRPILPVDVPRFAPAVGSAEQALAVAIAHRPELAQLALDKDAALLAVRAAENAQLPQIDLGLTGTLLGQDDAFGGAWSQVGSTDARGWSVLLNLTWTPLSRATSASAEIARLERTRTQARGEQLLQAVWLEVREAVRDQQGAERRVRAAARFRELAERSLEIEQRKFLNGTSQNLFVAQRQEALLAARLAELDALLGHVRATTGLARATGQLLDARHIELR